MVRTTKWVDYSHELKLSPKPSVRLTFVILSTCFLVLGIIGAFLPILPTTPFLLLSAYLYSRSSSRFYNWLMNQPILSPPLRLYKETGTIKTRNKVIAITMLAASLSYCILYLLSNLATKIMLATIGCVVAGIIVRIPRPAKQAFPDGD